MCFPFQLYAFHLIAEGLTAFRFSGIFFLRLNTVFLLQRFEVNYPIFNHVANDDIGGMCIKVGHQMLPQRNVV